MKLWIELENRRLCVGNICLQDGASPSINSQIIYKIEPGIWSKVLVLEWIFIDVDKSILHWSTCGCDLQASLKDMASRQCDTVCRHSHRLSLRSDMPYDAEFNRLLEIAKKMHSNTGQDAALEAVKLLHVYVLPHITFSKDIDAEKVKVAMEMQNETITRLDEEMNKVAEERSRRKSPMRDWRKALSEKLGTDTLQMINYGEKFLKLFAEGLRHDLKYGFVEVDKMSSRVVAMKEEGNHCSESKLMDVLQEINSEREKRLETMEYLTKALILRAEIDLLMEKGLVTPNPEQLPTEIESYVKTVEEYQRTIDDRLIELNEKKICAISVREALHRTLVELEKFEETTGMELDARGNNYSSDVFQDDNFPKELQTLQKTVTRLVEEEAELKTLKRKFKGEVIALCENRKSASAERPKPNPSKQPSKRRSAPEHEMEHEFEEKAGLLHEMFQEKRPLEHYQSLLIQLNRRIPSHFELVSNLLVSKYLPRGILKARAWLCYERCIFPDLFTQNILKLYQNAHRKKLQCLRNSLPTVKVEDLEMEGDTFLLNILGLYTGESKDIETKDNENEKDKEIKSLPLLEGGVVRRQHTQSERRHKMRRQTKFIDGILILPPVRSKSFTSSPLIDHSILVPPMPGTLSNKEDILDSMDSGISDGALTTYMGITVMVPTLKRLYHSSRFLAEHMNVHEIGEDAMNSLTDSGTTTSMGSGSEPTTVKKVLKLDRENFQKLYSRAIQSFCEIQKTPVPMKKLEWLQSCFDHIVEIAQKQADAIQCGKQYQLSSDESLTATILFLTNCDWEIVAQVYPHICFLGDYIPDFLGKGKLAFTMVNFINAYQYILDKLSKKMPVKNTLVF